MDPGSSSKVVARLKNISKRPDSLKADLITYHEDSVPRSALPENQVHIGFRGISYSVRDGIFRNRQRRLLKEVNGDFYAGELTAIMGPSGAGKSTLMNILAGYTTHGVKGQLQVNDAKRDEYNFRKRSCYIMQDDKLQPLLTVMEAMSAAANLKLSPQLNSKEKYKRVRETLEALGLWDCRKVKTEALSGGQRKRLAIALEILKNPQVMFFDEPTSGLDSSTTKQCIMLLKQLAQEGKTVICTIHQPSALVFEMFDHLYALAQGACIYQGSIKGLVPYLEESGLICPPYHNPADYLLEVANGEYGCHVEHLRGTSENGLSKDWRKRSRQVTQLQSIENIDHLIQQGLLTPIRPPPDFPPVSPTKKENSSDKPKKSLYTTSFYYQLYVLLKRTFLILSRDRTLTYSRIGTHVFIAIFIGTLYYGIGRDASDVLNNFNYMFFSLMFLMMTAFSCITTTFPMEMPIIIREHFNRWYSLKAYYLAITIADIPIQMTATLIYVATTYFMTHQPIEGFRMILFLAMCMLVSLVAQSLGLVIGASMDVKHGVIFGPFFLIPFVVFSGFFVQINSAHPILHWLFHISFLKYGFEGVSLAIFGYDRAKIPCELADYCHFVYPDKFLTEMNMGNSVYSHSVYFLVGLMLFLRVLAYLALYINIRRRR